MRQRFLILLLIGLACCKTKTNTVLPPLEIIVNVVDTNNKLLPFSVPVYLFNNQSAFLTASEYYTGTGAIRMDTTVNGQCTFIGIPGEASYYVYAHYKNYAVLQGGYYIDYDNSDNYGIAAVSLDTSATNRPTLTTNIVMKPRDGLVSFWTSDVNKDALPIQVFVDNNLFGTIDTTFNTQPFYTNSGVLNGLVRNGSHKYYASSANCSQCKWETAPLEVKGGQNFTIEFTTCNSGTVIFWTDSSNSAALPIDIFRSTDNSIIATITSVNSSAPDLFSTTAKFSDDPQTEIYTAQSRTNKNCFWTGNSYTIAAGQCNSFQISTCEK